MGIASVAGCDVRALFLIAVLFLAAAATITVALGRGSRCYFVVLLLVGIASVAGCDVRALFLIAVLFLAAAATFAVALDGIGGSNLVAVLLFAAFARAAVILGDES